MSFVMAVTLINTPTSMSRKQSYGEGWLDDECYCVKYFKYRDDMVQKLIYQIYKNPHPNIVVLTVGAGGITIVGSKLPKLEIENMVTPSVTKSLHDVDLVGWRCQLEQKKAVLEVVWGKTKDEER
ncbi:hypothetical protein ABKV19_010399 [Rosa sericea]